MNFKSSYVINLIDRVSPYLKNGGKSVEHPNRIHFKPSDVPELPELPKIPDMTVAKDATVAPFADRLIHPNLFGLSPSVNDTKILVRNTKNLIENCADEGIKNGFSKLYSKILDNSKDLPQETSRMTSLLKTVESVENPNIKSQILDKINFLSNCNPKNFKNFYPNIMSFMENYADAANTLSGKYMRIDNNAQKFYKWMDRNNIWLLDIIDGTKKSEETYRKGLLSSKTRHKKYPEYLKNYDEYTKKGLKQTFENNLKLDTMKQFFDKYFNTRKEAIHTLYHEEYLKTLSPEIAKECAEIQKEYNTYVITSNHDTTLEDIKYLKEELRRWKDAGGDDAVLPDVLYVNAIDESLLKNHSSGCANVYEPTVYVRELLQDAGNIDSESSTLRHEIQHLNDHESKKPKNSFEEINDAIKWKYNKIVYKKQWDKELENAGIKSEGHRAYAFTNKDELRSVTVESDMEKLSENFKQQMTKKFKMQPWIFKIGKNEVAENCKRAQRH